MTEAEFERAFRKQANPDGSGPKLNCISRRQIPFHPQDYSGSAASARYDRNLLDWKTSAGLRDPPSQEFHDSCEYTLNPDPSFLVHSGGVIPYVATCVTRVQKSPVLYIVDTPDIHTETRLNNTLDSHNRTPTFIARFDALRSLPRNVGSVAALAFARLRR